MDKNNAILMEPHYFAISDPFFLCPYITIKIRRPTDNGGQIVTYECSFEDS